MVLKVSYYFLGRLLLYYFIKTNFGINLSLFLFHRFSRQCYSLLTRTEHVYTECMHITNRKRFEFPIFNYFALR